MKLKLDAADEAFRREIRAFLEENLPPEMARRNSTEIHSLRDDTQAWTRVLARKGWSVPQWPKEYGGTGWSPLQIYLFEEECMRAGAPVSNMQAITLVGPVIYTFGSADQKRVHLPPIVNGELFWAQGFSEPNAGSDLASLRTRAVRDGDEYVITGQKIWTSDASDADWIFCLVRTNPDVKPQEGISFILVPANAPGVTIRPIRSLDQKKSLCETFLDEVRVPVANLVGEEGKGWSYAKFLLGNERVFSAEVPRNKKNLEDVKRIASREQLGQTPLIRHPSFASRVTQLEIDLLALEACVMRDLTSSHESPRALPVSSVVKTRGSEILQAVTELRTEALGPYGAIRYPILSGISAEDQAALPGPAYAPGVTAELLARRAATIYGGANEIQRNILAKSLLTQPEQSTAIPLEGEQRLLQESVQGWLQKNYSFEHRTQFIADAPERWRTNWKTFADMGWLGAALPEDVGGLGGTADETAILQEAFGRALIVEPFLGTAVLAAQAIDKGGTTAQREALLPGLIAGETLIALAHDEPGTRGRIEWVTTRATAQAGGFVLDGTKVLVEGAPLANDFIVSARTAGESGDRDGITLFRVPRDAKGIAVTDYRTVDDHVAGELTLKGVKVGADAVIGAEGSAFAALDHAFGHAIIAACAEAMGAMEKALWTSIDYLKTRRQFGTTLSTFQALQHRLADMFMRVELSRAMLYRGLESLRETDPGARRKGVSAAKAFIVQSGRYVCGQAIQLHGGIGLTEEYVVGHYFKRMLVIDALYGNADFHLNRYAEFQE